MPLNRNPRSNAHRLVDMSTPVEVWCPELAPVGEPWEQEFFTGPDRSYVQTLYYDERSRLVQWAVVRKYRNPETGVWRRSAVYDTFHGKGLHVHLYDGSENEIEERTISTIGSYADLDQGLDDVLAQIVGS